MEKLMRDFSWEGQDNWGGLHLVNWDQVCKTKKNGGLGIENLLHRNKALINK